MLMKSDCSHFIPVKSDLSDLEMVLERSASANESEAAVCSM